MKDNLNNDVVINADAFAIATQMYVRMRRVSGRVIDVMYLVHNQDYARYIADLALATEDQELERYVARLSTLIDLLPTGSPAKKLEKIETIAESLDVSELYTTEVTEEEIYQAQVHHHYIGALR
ncbi:hypothetical protein F2A31_06410 [Acinetobacter suaedae]|uniref:Uncharacterized protein n=1 Tax=Acinetobacter suaedae TaxID=2609668 RepID=A0A5P1USN5_9GAMM|nr:hypothetical protein [Acinetobacter sp. C16S1]QER39358.1 hypothetical protein F2A31_06410 [Acinetobacter sp. C16S1]